MKGGVWITKKRVVIAGAGRPHERSDLGESIGRNEAQSLGVKRLGLLRVWYEVDDVGQGARFRSGVGVGANHVHAPLWRGARRVHVLTRQGKRLAHGQLEAEAEAQVVGGPE